MTAVARRASATASSTLEALAKIHGREAARNPGSTPLDHLVHGILATGVPSSRARAAWDGLRATFTDFNELRVAEIHEILPALEGLGDAAIARARAALLRRALQGLFDALDRVRIDISSPEEGEEVRRVLTGVPGLPPGVVAAVVCRATEGHPIVPNRAMSRAAQRLGLVPKGATDAKTAAALAAAAGTPEGRVLLTYLLTEHGETCCGDRGSGCDSCPVCGGAAAAPARRRAAR